MADLHYIRVPANGAQPAAFPAGLGPAGASPPSLATMAGTTTVVSQEVASVLAPLALDRTWLVDLSSVPGGPTLLAELVRSGTVEAAWRAHRVARPGFGGVSIADPPQETPRALRLRERGGVGLAEARAAGVFGPLLGQGAKVWLVERGRAKVHPDLPDLQLTGWTPGLETEHGTRTAGIVQMLDNDIGGVGIAPLADVELVPPYLAHDPNVDVRGVARAILTAVGSGAPGDVIVVEEGLSLENSSEADLPAECDLFCLVAIVVATAGGRHVVELAGNTSQNLDEWSDQFGRRLNRDEPAWLDSGAIVVGGVEWDDIHQDPARWIPWPCTNGNRLDCVAQAVSVRTTSARVERPWVRDHCGTSAAAAIVAGAVSVIAGAGTTQRKPVSPRDVRAAIAGGTKAGAGPGVPARRLLDVEVILRQLLQD